MSYAFFNPLKGLSFKELETYHKQQLQAIRTLLTDEEMTLPIEDLSEDKRNWYHVYINRANAAMVEMKKITDNI